MPAARKPDPAGRSFRPWALLVAALGLGLAGPIHAQPPDAKSTPEDAAEAKWTSLFDGKNLGKWQIVDKFDYENHGQVHVDDGRLLLDAGKPGTGVRWTGEFPKIDYEITLEAMRVTGGDFFCGMTFPVGKSALTLVVGGWSGEVVGISSIDGEPAVENETCTLHKFERNKWYRIRLRVTRTRIEAWLDKEKVVDLATANRQFSIYWEVEPCLPLGIATWRTGGALRDIRVRELTPRGGKGKPASSEPLAEAGTNGPPWTNLFDGKQLGDWKVVDAYIFAAHGEVAVKEGKIVLGKGRPATGIRYTGEVPRTGYEIALEAMRAEGEDFFCGLTLPVGEAPVTLIVGGWKGPVVGLSNINDKPAAENESTVNRLFKKGVWYPIRVRVTGPKIEAWIGREKVIDVPTAGRKFSVWWQQEPMLPLGISSWETGAAVRNLRLRRLAPPAASEGSAPGR